MSEPCSSKSVEGGNLLKVKEKERNEVEAEVEVEEDPPRESRYAEYMLPEEIWTMIFELVGDKENLWQISQTCLHFQDVIIKPSKNAWLFSQILPLVSEQLTGKDMLKCRTVCKGWRDGVDNYFENHPSIIPHDDRTYNSPWRSPPWITPMEEKGIVQYTYRGELEGSVFPKMFNHPRNPFIGRRLIARLPRVHRDLANLFECQYGDPNYYENLDKLEDLFCGNLLVMLDKLGEHIWYLELKAGYDLYQMNTLARVAVNRFICGMLLDLVPNLRTLKISGCLEKEGDKESLDKMWLDVELPEHRYLTKLELYSSSYGFYSDPTAIMKVEKELLEKYHGQLKSLRMPDPRRFGWKRFHKLRFSKLTELDIGNIGCLYRTVETHMDLFSNLTAPNLRKLTIDISTLKSTDIQHLLNALNIIPRAMESLNVLRLNVGYLLPFADEVKRWLRPNSFNYQTVPRYFTTVEICDHSRIGFRRFCNMATKKTNFLYLFHAVKNISYHTARAPFGSTIPEECKVIMPETEAYKLDLWKELQDLRVLACEKTIYTRSRYQYFKEKENILADEKTRICQQQILMKHSPEPVLQQMCEEEIAYQALEIVARRSQRMVQEPDRFEAN